MIKLTRHMAIAERITSRDNQRLAAVRKVRDGLDETRMFIEGVRLVGEAVRSGVEIEECFVSDEFDLEKLPELASRAVPVADRLFPSISDTKTPQGVVALARRPDRDLKSVASRINSASPIVLYLTEINIPQNLGAILRTAEAAGVAGVIVSRGSADPYAPKALRAAMGSAFRLTIVTGIARSNVLAWAAENRLVTTAADVGAKTNYFDIDWKVPRLLVFGSEAHGLSEGDLSTIDENVLIPMDENVESLNLAVSAGVILFEARRQIRG